MKRTLLLAVVLAFVGQTALAQVNPAQQPATPVVATKADADFRQRVIDAANDYSSGKTDLPGSVSRFESLNTERSDDIDVEAWLGFLYLRSDRANDAIPLLEKAAKARDNDLEVRNNLANAYASTKQYDLALKTYADVISLKSTLAEPYYNRGVIYLQQKQYSPALAEFQKAYERKQDDPFILNNMGVAYQALNQSNEAASAFKRAADMRPDSRVFAKNAAVALGKIHRSQDALPYWERVAKLDPEDSIANQALAEEYGRQHRIKEALSYYEKLQGKLGGKASYWYNLGVFRDQAQDTEGAQQAYEKSVELDATDADALNNLGLIYYKKARYSDAARTFEQAYKLAPKSQTVLQSYGASLSQSGERARAVVIWKELLDLQPGRTDIRVLVADSLFAQNDFTGAAAQYRMVVNGDPKSVQALNGLGLIHLKESRLPDAEASFKSAIKAKPDFVPAYNNLAVTLERLNRRKEAIRLLQKALTIEPNNEDVRKNLQRMKAAG